MNKIRIKLLVARDNFKNAFKKKNRIPEKTNTEYLSDLYQMKNYYEEVLENRLLEPTLSYDQLIHILNGIDENIDYLRQEIQNEYLVRKDILINVKEEKTTVIRYNN